MEGVIAGYIVAGVAALLASCLITRRREGIWISPATLFFVAFTGHAFLGPYVGYTEGVTTLNLDTLPIILFLSMVAFLSMLGGYSVYVFRADVSGRSGPPELFGRTASIVASVIAMILVTYMWFHLFTSGVLQEGKGVSAYATSASAATRMAIVAQSASSPLILALFASTFTLPEGARESIRWIVWILGLLLVGTAFLTFSRSQVAILGVYLIVFYHFRVSALTGRQISAIVVIAFITTAFAGLRILASGWLSMAEGEVADTLWMVAAELTDPLTFLLAMGSALAGQEVFSQVVLLVPAEDSFKYGATYLESAISLLFPRVVTGDYSDIRTPAFWFKDLYAPYTVGHGFDFSMMSEAYLNFGAFYWIVFLFIGWWIGKISATIRLSESGFLVVWNIIILAALVYGLRSDSNTLFKAIAYFISPVAVVLAFQERRAIVSQFAWRGTDAAEISER